MTRETVSNVSSTATKPPRSLLRDASVPAIVAGFVTVLVGFSQGTMMALHAGLRRAVAPAAIVGDGFERMLYVKTAAKVS